VDLLFQSKHSILSLGTLRVAFVEDDEIFGYTNGS
jgi:hypothetical protein